MLVKVNDAYKGVFGLYIEKYHSVEAKRAGDPPFELADDVAHAQIKNGVLTAAEAYEAPEEPGEDEAAEKAVKDVSEMTYRELVAACKERGISYKGKKTEELKEILSSLENPGEAPDLAAEDPI